MPVTSVLSKNLDNSPKPPTLDPRPYHRKDAGDVLAVGLATTVLMWSVGYIFRMPGDRIPAPVILAALVAIIIGGGFMGAWRTRRGPVGGLWVGLISGSLNLLVLGSLGRDLTTDQRIVAYEFLWAPISVLTAGLLAWLGGYFGAKFNPDRRQYLHPEGSFTLSTALATLVLIMAGGMVTGLNAGLSVPDWPDSFKFGMFFFPLSHMTGGVFFEHTHRLLGTLVGLATLIQTIYLFRHEQRRWVKWTALTALIMVIVQGLMGGLRVTGHFTLARSRLGMDPSTPLAIVHGAFGQVFFAVLVLLAAVCSPSWTSDLKPKPRLSAQIGRGIAWTLVGVLLVQLTLGAILRHIGGVLLLHISVAVVVLLLALFSGARAWGLNQDQPILKRIGVAMLCVVTLQVLLGVCAVIALGGGGPLEHPDLAQAVVTTAHQTTGAVLLAVAVLLAMWTVRLESPVSLKALDA
jgi:cytochrome c oxidase assembly protein subunit 15